MRSSLLRSLAVFAILALTACGGQSMMPGQSSVGASLGAPQVTSMPFQGDLIPDVTDPCKTIGGEGLWYFHGSCLQEKVQKSSTPFRLKAYKGITQTLTYPAVSGTLASGTALITGEGTGSADITGSFSGQKFPLYASKSVKCVSNSSAPTACTGKALVYDLLVNASSSSVTFVGSPSVVLVAPTALKGKKGCNLDELIQSGGSWEYLITPVKGTVKAGKVTLPSFKSSFSMKTHFFNAYAVSCQ